MALKPFFFTRYVCDHLLVAVTTQQGAVNYFSSIIHFFFSDFKIRILEESGQERGCLVTWEIIAVHSLLSR